MKKYILFFLVTILMTSCFVNRRPYYTVIKSPRPHYFGTQYYGNPPGHIKKHCKHYK